MTNVKEHRFWLNAKKMLSERLSLTDDKADDNIIDDRIRGDVQMKGSNLWILMFAIFVASIGSKCKLNRRYHWCHVDLSSDGADYGDRIRCRD